MGKAEELLGSLHAQAFINLVAEIEAFGSAADLMDFLGDGACVVNDDALHLTIGLDYEGSFLAVDARIVRTDTGTIDWTSVRRLKLVQIVGK